MKILVLVAHPDYEHSRVSRCWVEELRKSPYVTVHNLQAMYPTGQINIYYERELILRHDRIVFQFPLLWFQPPSILKKWQDEVLTYLWNGSEGDKLRGKELLLAMSMGAKEEDYQPNGLHALTMEEIICPYQALARLIGMNFLPSFQFYNAVNATHQEIQESAKRYVEHILEVSATPIA
ncbi:NAD(P)H-dependent oxidoreductase [Thermoflavimicrobium daqui]|jgi:putative NADPH-quinone reductase|uniref:General stress protein n=1 Tax=Thermoflavimicrobium daqui TaxID=2137476 RepID=A0A364K577_9BACL|nr:NAD(P)H-dependent oxidoreductase [Thermoflavimicrobium daqui]RAL24431.1 general stress protein [Thermoflavimicrobium daqui]